MPAGFDMSLRYEDPGLGDMKVDDPQARMKMAVAKWVGELLNRHYPGHAWHVEVKASKTGGLIMIRLNGIMPADRWYCIQLNDAFSDPSGHLVKRGAGELLERYRIPRGNFDLDHWRGALNAMPLSAKITGKGHLAPLID